MIEALAQPEIMVGLESLGILALALAFSTKVRRQIGQRDKWTCQEEGCDRQFREGWMLHASHDPEHHSKDDPLYDTPEAGDMRCIEHHLEQHLNGTSLGPAKDAYAVLKLRQTDSRTYEWRLAHDRLLADDTEYPDDDGQPQR